VIPKKIGGKKSEGKKLGPRYELLNEIYFAENSLKVFHMYDTSNFLKHSKQYLKINIKDQSIKEAKDLIEYHNINKQIVSSDNNVISIKEYIKQVNRQIPIKVLFSSGFDAAPFLNIPNEVFHFALMEIFSNVSNHSPDRTVTVRIKEEGDFLVLRFKNLVSSNIQTREHRGKGLDYIRSVINKHYGFVEAETTDEYFQIEIFIEKRFTSSQKKTTIPS